MSVHGVSFHARGMHCPGCEHVIEDSVRKLRGVRKVKADYPTETVAVVFDPASTNIEEICAAVAQKGYRCFLPDDIPAPPNRVKKLAGLILGLAGILLIIFLDAEFISPSGAPDIGKHMGYGLIFVLGLLTGFHCVGMCGGFVLSYTASDARLGRQSYLSHVLYGAGKTLSYTGIGAMFGLLGAIIAFTPLLRGAAGMIAGAFLIIFGLNMLGLFAPLRRIRITMPAFLVRFVGRRTRSYNRPFVIGLLNGLMIACGPLQAMYVMAAGTGSAVEGAKMLFTFGVGTLPVLLSFGVLSTFISGALTHQLLKLSGAIVIILGAVMINRGLILTGSGYDLRALIDAASRASRSTPPSMSMDASQTAVQTIVMDVTRSGYSPNHFILRKGAPVRWIINGEEITTCNRRILAPKLGLEFDVKKGPQVIEFTPMEEGVIPWSCWMGMLHGAFEVIGEPPAEPGQPAAVPNAPAEASPAPALINPAAPAQALVGSYRIEAGDSLQRIAAKLYHDPQGWPGIAKANPGLDPRRLRPGQVIKLPRPAPKS
ncbi:sulfite exporter TauE/SafE family protein [Methylocapsa polymorpha]|uniref:Sulfite exporter TauE/SafE family protein n=1 Tax=Methylocapsa polymorpha TaxID=3080828 RepID=A0ABZ0HQD2_9HYPH|nr:sulfite exporter TauE/SafE family protein [Methylocapsa sp. RX1]